MQRRTPSRAVDLLLFAGIAVATALAIHAVGLFQRGSSAGSALDRLERLPRLVVSRVTRDLGLGSPSRSPEPEPARERAYRVQPGDVLSRIAARHQVTVEAIVARNRLADPDRLDVGDTLVIPLAPGTTPETGPVGAAAAADPGAPPVPAREVAAAPAPGGWARWIGRLTGEPAAVPDAAPDASLRPVEALLGMAEEELRGARFEAALHTTAAAERLLQDLPPSHTRAQRARLEVVRATVHIAFGRQEEAAHSLEQALQADPRLALDPDSTPRKLRRLLDRVRSGPSQG